ncbi:hypothetical protein QE152_g41111 [Popillia japonica]|uniref:Uncharacterized protein n=1 Tax=Popillia japonica TaxID=7064 RepID=A0AAW1H5X2_POPJA
MYLANAIVIGNYQICLHKASLSSVCFEILFRTFPEKRGEDITEQYLTSPFFPKSYPKDLSVEYVLNCRTTEFCKIKLIFTDFQVSRSSLIEFFDWNGQRIFVTTGSLFRPPILISSGPSMIGYLLGNITYLSNLKIKEHIVAINEGIYVSLTGAFDSNSKLEIVYAAFSYKDCAVGSDFLLLAITWGDIGTSSLSPIESSTNVLPVTNASTAIEFPPITDNLTSSTNSLDANCNDLDVSNTDDHAPDTNLNETCSKWLGKARKFEFNPIDLSRNDRLGFFSYFRKTNWHHCLSDSELSSVMSFSEDGSSNKYARITRSISTEKIS